jgi:hypothetical protein
MIACGPSQYAERYDHRSQKVDEVHEDWAMAVGSFTCCCTCRYSSKVQAALRRTPASARPSANKQANQAGRSEHTPMSKEAQVARAGLCVAAHGGAVPAGASI